MYYLSRKSIRLTVAGVILLLFFSCTTTLGLEELSVEQEPLSLETMFPKDSNNLVYVNSRENVEIIDSLLNRYLVDSVTRSIVLESHEIFLAVENDFNDGFDLLLNGDISKSKMEFGMFLSISWRKVNDNGYRYWVNRDGIKIFFINDNTIIVSNKDIKDLINKNIHYHSYLSPKSSVLLIKPKLTSSEIKTLSRGFIKGGLNNITISLDKITEEYELIAEIGVKDGKAKGFSQLLKLFFKIGLSNSDNSEVSKIASTLEIKVEDDSVIVDNIVLDHIKIVELLNSLLVMSGDTDK